MLGINLGGLLKICPTPTNSDIIEMGYGLCLGMLIAPQVILMQPRLQIIELELERYCISSINLYLAVIFSLNPIWDLKIILIMYTYVYIYIFFKIWHITPIEENKGALQEGRNIRVPHVSECTHHLCYYLIKITVMLFGTKRASLLLYKVTVINGLKMKMKY